MRNSIYIFIILFSISKPALCGRFEHLDSAFQQSVTIDDFKKCLSKFIADTTLTSEDEQINRSIDFNCSQVIYYLRQECFEFQVYLVARNDTIVIGKIQELDYFKEGKIIKSNIFKLQTKIIDNYLDKYFAYYETKVTRKIFIKQMTNFEEYGFGCGLSRSYYPKFAKMTRNYVDKKNYKSLSKMLRSPVPEIKAYGATGLIQLEKTGLKINNKEKTIIEHYKELNFSIYSCYGCLSGPKLFTSVITWEWRQVSR